MIQHIIAYKIRASLRGESHWSAAAIIRYLLVAMIYSAFAVGTYSLAFQITKYLLTEAYIGTFLVHRFLSMLLFVFFVTVNLGNILVLYSTLFKSAEVHFLMTKPVHHSSIFVIKFLDNFFYSSGTLLLFALSAIAGYGTFMGYTLVQSIGLFTFVMIPFMFISACVAALVLLGIMRLAVRIGFRVVMSMLGVLYLVGVIVFFMNYNPIGLVEKMGEYSPDPNQLFFQLDPPYLKYMINAWVSDILFHASLQGLAASVPLIVMLNLLTVGLFMIVLGVGGTVFYRIWLATFQMGQRRISDRKTWLVRLRASGILSPFSVLRKRDWLLFIREAAQWIHALVLLLLITMFVLSIKNVNPTYSLEFLPVALYLAIFGFSGFLMASLSLRFIFPLMSLEGLPLWSILSAPVERMTLYRLKLRSSLALIVPLTIVVAIATHIPFITKGQADPLFMLSGVLVSIVMSIVIVILNLGLGILFANFREKNPIRIASSQGATITFLITILYLVLCTGFLFLPVKSYLNHLMLNRPFVSEYVLIAMVGLLTLSIIYLIAGLLLGRRIRQLQL